MEAMGEDEEAAAAAAGSALESRLVDAELGMITNAAQELVRVCGVRCVCVCCMEEWGTEPKVGLLLGYVDKQTTYLKRHTNNNWTSMPSCDIQARQRLTTPSVTLVVVVMGWW